MMRVLHDEVTYNLIVYHQQDKCDTCVTSASMQPKASRSKNLNDPHVTSVSLTWTLSFIVDG